MAYISKITLPNNNGAYDLKDGEAIHYDEVETVSIPQFQGSSSTVLSGTNASLLGDTALTATGNTYTYTEGNKTTTITDYSLDLGAVLTSISPIATTVTSQSVSSFTSVAAINLDSNQ